MIPEFPSFASMQLKYVPEIQKLAANLPEYSDYNPASLIAWDTKEDIQISNLRGNLVIIFNDYMDESRFASMYGIHHVIESTELLMQYADGHGLGLKLKLVPEETAKELMYFGDYRVVPDRDNYDYVIGLEKTSQMSGREFRKLRREVTAFTTKHRSTMSLDTLILHDKSHVEEILTVFRHREAVKPTNHDQLELAAIRRLISLNGHFDLVVRGIRVNGALEAFVIIEKSRSQLVEHFCKGNTSFTGINQYLLVTVCQELRNEGFVHMNIEQDLGISGLRMTKESFRPIAYLKKYTIQRVAPAPSAAAQAHQQLSLKLQPVR